jgi:predicted translin family RNA/ssDNA-binding protein
MEAKLSSLETSYNNNVNTYNAAIDTAMSDGVITASEQEALDAQKTALEEQERKINELKEAYSQYEDTLNVVIEAENEMLDI